MHTILKYDLSNFVSDQSNVAIRNSIQTDESFGIPFISKANVVRNQKRTLKVSHISHM